MTTALVDVRDLSRHFDGTAALADVTLTVAAGEIHAVLGPNGAGKTTLLRVLTGLLSPSSGEVRVAGRVPGLADRESRRRVAMVPSGDRSFYLRISGMENLVFFARLQGLRRRAAVRRAREVLDAVGLGDVARRRVGLYSHGMQKRLSVARALLTDPDVLVVDEATHDLDPDGARRVQELVARVASRGAAIVWATQRLDEIRGFADRVSLLHRGMVRFVGSVPQLLSATPVQAHLLAVRANGAANPVEAATVMKVLDGMAVRVDPAGDGQVLVALADGAVLGRAVAALAAAGIDVLSCHEGRSQLEEAFLALTRDGEPVA